MSLLLSRLSYRSAGESHGAGITVVLEGLPRGLLLDLEAIDAELRRRQGGAGRSGRQRIEHDQVVVRGGVRRGATLGSPLALWIANRDARIDTAPSCGRPRPGHADLAGCYRYGDRDVRATLERASARETAGRVAAGAVVAQLLAVMGCAVFGFVRAVGSARLAEDAPVPECLGEVAAARQVRDATRLYTLDAAADAAMLQEVAAAAQDGDTVGGIVEVQAVGVPAGLGSCLQWCERLDARLGAAILSIPALKGVELGDGFAAAQRRGSAVHDPILPGAGMPGAGGGLRRPTNRAGGLEGGMTNGQPVLVRGAMKPIATLRQPLPSVDLETGAPASAGYERADICAVAAAAVIAQAMVALVLADAALARLGGETVDELVERAAAHRARIAALGAPPAS